MIRNQFLYLGFFFFITGCGVPEVSVFANGNFPPPQLVNIISPKDQDVFETTDDGVFKPKEQHAEFFDEFNLSEKSKNVINNKQLTFYYTTGNEKVKLSVPFKLLKRDSQLCLPFSSQYQFCTEQKIGIPEIVNSKEIPLVFKLKPILSQQVRSRNTYLIVVSPTSVFQKDNMATLVQQGLINVFTAYKADYKENEEQAPDFKLLKTISGRIISRAILTKEKLLSGYNGKNDLKSFFSQNLQFNVVDWRPVRDLALVESQIDDVPPKAILYITGNDGLSNFDENIPRNQCIPLAWKRDDIELLVITNKGCDVWQTELEVQHCLELDKHRTDKEGVFSLDEREKALEKFGLFMTKNFFSK